MKWVRVSTDSGFSASKYPVTVGEYAEFIAAGGYRNPEYWSTRGWAWNSVGQPDTPKYWGQDGYRELSLPVTGVCYWEAEAFARFANARLPNETEWYYVASNGRDDKYPWGGDAPSQRTANLAFFGHYAASARRSVFCCEGASAAGVCDLIGNVSEWCLPDDSQALPRDTVHAVLRGGACWHTPVVVDNRFRDCVKLETRDNQTGIRLVRGNLTTTPAVGSASYKRMTTGFYVADESVAVNLNRPSKAFRQEGVPQSLDEDKWRLNVDGCVNRPLALSLNALRSDWPSVEVSGLFVCVCRWADVTSARGVLVRDIIDAAQPSGNLEELFIHQRSIIGSTGKAYISCVPLAQAIRHRAMLCYEINHAPLSLDLGWPVRYLDLSLYGYKQVKCLAELYISNKFEVGWWEEAAGYDPSGAILPGDVTVVGAPASGYTIGE